MFCACAFAEDVQAEIQASRRTAIVRAIEAVAPAVCSINVVQIERPRIADPFFRGFWDFFDYPPARGFVRERQIDSVGSGFFIDDKGHILTNYHVIEDADRISSVTLADGRELEVDYVGGDRRSDLAVLEAKGEGLPYAALGDSNGLMTGEWVVAIGNPFGTLMSDPQPTASVGIVSAHHRRVSRDIGGGNRLYQDLIQTDAAINPGNSGGPLANALGEVVGVNTLIFSESGGSNGLGFALPINRAKRVFEEIVTYGRRRDPWPGFIVEAVGNLRPGVLRRLGIQAEQGCIVTEMRSDCPAHRAGLELADVITHVNGQAVFHPSDIDFIVWERFVGDTLGLTIDRQGQSLALSFALTELDTP